MLTGKILITGGAGTLGTAIVERATREKWDCDITVFSRDWEKHRKMRYFFPNVNYVVGDILSRDMLNMACAGMDIVIHAAAMKHVVEGEKYPLSVFDVNVGGSLNVVEACVDQNVKDVIAISTDKACHPVNAYGCSKMMMERIFQRYAERYEHTNFHLVRYGNVIDSTGSFVPVWRRQIEEGNYITLTDPDMTRFWLKVDEAIDLILVGMEVPSGSTLIPIPKNAKMGNIATVLVPEDVEKKIIGIRPGEKINECLLTPEESYRADYIHDRDDVDMRWIRLYPAVVPPFATGPIPIYSSDDERMLDAEGIKEMFGEL